MLCATLGMMIMAGGIDLITIFIGLETMAVSFYILAGFIKPSQRSNEAAVKYFLLGAFSLGILLYGMSLMYGLSGTTNLRRMAPLLGTIQRRSAAGPGGDPRGRRRGLQDCGGAVPHVGARRVRRRADADHGVPVGRLEGGVVRDAAADFPRGAARIERRLARAVLGAVDRHDDGRQLRRVTQSNMKRMLAYSSIAHAGYLLMGVVAGTSRGVTAMLIYLVVYSFMQLGAFAVIVLLRRQDVVGDELKDFSGLHFRSPFAAFAMLIFMLSLGGIPPTAGFMGKFWLFGAAIDAGYYWLAMIGVLNSAISLYYYVRVVVFMYIKTERAGSEPSMSPATRLRAGGGGGGDARPGRLSPSAVRRRRRPRRGRWAPRSRPRALTAGSDRDRISINRLGGVATLRELFHKVRYTPSRLSGYAGTMARKDPSRCWSGRPKPCRKTRNDRGRRPGPATP
jgi:NADH-quinone oxidoreductase subunit N